MHDKQEVWIKAVTLSTLIYFKAQVPTFSQVGLNRKDPLPNRQQKNNTLLGHSKTQKQIN